MEWLTNKQFLDCHLLHDKEDKLSFFLLQNIKINYILQRLSKYLHTVRFQWQSATKNWQTGVLWSGKTQNCTNFKSHRKDNCSKSKSITNGNGFHEAQNQVYNRVWLLIFLVGWHFLGQQTCILLFVLLSDTCLSLQVLSQLNWREKNNLNIYNCATDELFSVCTFISACFVTTIASNGFTDY